MNPFFDVLKGKRPPVTPVWFMRQAGRFLPSYRKIRARAKDFFDLCRNVELSVRITELPIVELGVDAAILFSDLLVPLLPLKSMEVSIKEGTGPVIETKVPLEKAEELLHHYDVEEELGFVAEIIKGFKGLHPDIPLIGFCGAPFTLLSYVIEGGGSKGLHRTKRFMLENSKSYKELSRRLTQILARFARMQKEAGVDAFQVFDSWAGVLSPEDYREFALEDTKGLIEAAKEDGLFVIYFSTGTCGTLKLIRELPADAFSVDWRQDIADAVSVLGTHRVIQGNLDPCCLFMPRDELKNRVLAILQGGRAARAHIFNLGHGVLPETDPDVVKWVVDLVHGE